MGLRGREMACRTIVAIAAMVAIGANGAGVGARSTMEQAAWADQDIGSPAIAGSATSSGASGYTITAAGTDIGGASDQFHFVYQPITGDVDVRARVDSLSYSSPWAKAGVMVRGSLADNGPHGFALVSAGRGNWFQRRARAGGATTRTAGVDGAPPAWVRLVRRGNTVSAYSSPDGGTWTLIASATVLLGPTAYVGLAVTSRSATTATTAILSQISVTPLGLAAGQQAADIGAPAIAGSTGYSGGTYQIHAGGTDIAGTADQFHFVYQQASGNLDLRLRVGGITAASPGAKAGLMIRDTLTAGSAHAYAALSAMQGAAFHRRHVVDDATVSTSGSMNGAPRWLRLTRSGTLFTAYESADGQNWTAVGSDSMTMADTVYIGIAVTSQNATLATDVIADSFSVAQTGTENQPPTVSITSPADNATFTAPASITIAASAADPENQLTKVEFYNGPTLLGTVTSAPYAFAWSSVPAGTYSLTAVAYDAAGVNTRSVAATVTVDAATAAPTGAIFTASTDHATVTSYRLDVFAEGVDVTTATPVATMDVGKPAPDVNHDITVSAPAFFNALAAGTYQLTASAIGAGGTGRSSPIAFTR